MAKNRFSQRISKIRKKTCAKKGPERPKPTGPLPVRETDTFSIGCDRSEK